MPSLSDQLMKMHGLTDTSCGIVHVGFKNPGGDAVFHSHFIREAIKCLDKRLSDEDSDELNPLERLAVHLLMSNVGLTREDALEKLKIHQL